MLLDALNKQIYEDLSNLKTLRYTDGSTESEEEQMRDLEARLISLRRIRLELEDII